MIQVEEFGVAIVCWLAAAAKALFSLFKYRLGKIVSLLVCLSILVVSGALIKWTVLKKADKPWSAFLQREKTPEEIRSEIVSWLALQKPKDTTEAPYHFKIDLPVPEGESLNFIC